MLNWFITKAWAYNLFSNLDSQRHLSTNRNNVKFKVIREWLFNFENIDTFAYVTKTFGKILENNALPQPKVNIGRLQNQMMHLPQLFDFSKYKQFQ